MAAAPRSASVEVIPEDKDQDGIIVTLQIQNASSSLPDRRLVLTPSRCVVPIGRSSKDNHKGLAPASDNAWLDNPVMSRAHAELFADFKSHTVHLRDVGSFHGTYVTSSNKGSQTSPAFHLIPNQAIELTGGDLIQFGTNIYRAERTYPPCFVKLSLTKMPTHYPNHPRTFTVPDDIDDEYEQLCETCSTDITAVVDDAAAAKPDIVDLTNDRAPFEVPSEEPPVRQSYPKKQGNHKQNGQVPWYHPGKVVDLTTVDHILQVPPKAEAGSMASNTKPPMETAVETPTQSSRLIRCSSGKIFWKSPPSHSSHTNNHGIDTSSDIDENVSGEDVRSLSPFLDDAYDSLNDAYDSDKDSNEESDEESDMEQPSLQIEEDTLSCVSMADDDEDGLFVDDLRMRGGEYQCSETALLTLTNFLEDTLYAVQCEEEISPSSPSDEEDDDENEEENDTENEEDDDNEDQEEDEQTATSAAVKPKDHEHHAGVLGSSPSETMAVEAMDSDSSVLSHSWALRPSALKDLKPSAIQNLKPVILPPNNHYHRDPSPSDAVIFQHRTSQHRTLQAAPFGSRAQQLGEKSGKYEYFAAREHNRLAIKLNEMPEEVQKNDKPPVEEMETSRDTSPSPSDVSEELPELVEADGDSKAPDASSIKLDDDSIKLDDDSGAPGGFFSIKLDGNHGDQYSAWSSSGHQFLVNPIDSSIDPSLDRQINPNSTQKELDMTSAFTFQRSKLVTAAETDPQTRRVPIEELLEKELEPCTTADQPVREASGLEDLSTGRATPPKRSYEEAFEEDINSQEKDLACANDCSVVTCVPAKVASDAEEGMPKLLQETSSTLTEVKTLEPVTVLVRPGAPSPAKRMRLATKAAQVVACVALGSAATFSYLVNTAPVL
ncbi:hypothetical protein F4808DRAFT_438890 [Astrocystis sublimbata]|nr:hypothetical protein F4808DRAFT_438890 [Astrocystis sublimbata]